MSSSTDAQPHANVPSPRPRAALAAPAALPLTRLSRASRRWHSHGEGAPSVSEGSAATSLRPVPLRPALLLIVAMVLLGACGDDGEDLDRRAIPAPTTGPYVSVAVDNHFHDVHVEDDIELAADRSLVVKNQGRNLHNVTLPEADIDVDIAVGEEWELGPPLSEHLEPGRYTFFCKYHAEDGMLGAITIVEP